ncbi:MAG TPA: 50S ribosomal protein L25/general stress protein Ctc [Bacteroidia bacterium]|nr:50S ribosomal protein L25/general stress protein Ctc [Bacteroidia bacterium]
MKTIKLNGALRTKSGKKDAMHLRREAKVPCILYGGKETVTFSVIEKDFKPLVFTPEIHAVKLDVGGKEYNAILQDIQYHTVTDHIIHADFLEVVPGKSVVMNVPVQTEGTAPGVKAGGKLQKKLRTVRVKGPVEKMIDVLRLDVSKLEIGDSIRVGDLKYDGLTFLQAPNITVVGVRITRNVVEETPAAAATTAAAPAAGAPAAGAAAAKTDDKKAPAADAKKPAGDAKAPAKK